jgi:hypothetical protein
VEQNYDLRRSVRANRSLTHEPSEPHGHGVVNHKEDEDGHMRASKLEPLEISGISRQLVPRSNRLSERTCETRTTQLGGFSKRAYIVRIAKPTANPRVLTETGKTAPVQFKN